MTYNLLYWQWLVAALTMPNLLDPARLPGADQTALAQFTGAHTRVVWLQDHGKAANDVLAAGKLLRLMKFDSDDGQGEMALLEELRNYSRPLLTPDGQRVVFSDQFAQKFFVINWDGTGQKVLGDGFALDVCRDPGDGSDWVYVAKRVGKTEVAVYRGVRRVKLDDPKVSQKIWDQTDVSSENFQLSADLTRAGSDFPWPHGGVADLAKKTWKKLDQGCWPSIAPDNSGLNWVLDGPHRHLQFHRPDQANGWKVDISTAPGVKGAEVFHPRWSNHVRFLALSGPYQIQGPINLISGGGPQVEIHLGKFSPDFRSIENWFQLTENTYADIYPDVWTDGGEAAVIELPGLKNDPARDLIADWPAVTQSLIFAWSNGSVANQLSDAASRPGHSCKVTPHGAAIFGRFFDLQLRGGSFTLDDVEQSLLKAVQGPDGLTLEMLVTPKLLTTNESSICEIGAVGQPHLQLRQMGSRLFLKVGTDQGYIEVPVWKTLDGSVSNTQHIALALSPKKMELFLDGKIVGEFPVSLRPESWKSGEIRLGSTGWRGQIEAVAIHRRKLSATEVHREAMASRHRLLIRKPIPRIQVQAKCLEPSSIPTLQQILPYRRALAVDVCEVVQIEALGLKPPKLLAKPGDKVLIARWVILDGQPLSNAVFKLGSQATFTLERLTDHPELESERQVIDTTEVDLPTWYHVDD